MTTLLDKNNEPLAAGDKVLISLPKTDFKFPCIMVEVDGQLMIKHRSPKIKPMLKLSDCTRVEKVNT